MWTIGCKLSTNSRHKPTTSCVPDQIRLFNWEIGNAATIESSYVNEARVATLAEYDWEQTASSFKALA